MICDHHQIYLVCKLKELLAEVYKATRQEMNAD